MATGVFVTTFVQLQCLGNLPFYSLLMNRLGLDSVQAIAMNVAIVFGSTAAGGLLVEAGRQFGVSGRLSSLRVLAQNLGASIGVPLGGLLAGQALGVTSAVAVFPLLCMFCATWLFLREPAATRRDAVWAISSGGARVVSLQ